MPSVTQWLGEEPQSLRRYIQESDDPEMRLRRGVVAVSLIGVGAMALTTLLQMGLVRTFRIRLRATSTPRR